MQPVQDCSCRVVLFQGFVVRSNLSYFIALKVYHREDIRQVSFFDNNTDSQIELKSLTCIKRRFFVGSEIMH